MYTSLEGMLKDCLSLLRRRIERVTSSEQQRDVADIMSSAQRSALSAQWMKKAAVPIPERHNLEEVMRSLQACRRFTMLAIMRAVRLVEPDGLYRIQSDTSRR
jgi:hypothetical protein